MPDVLDCVRSPRIVAAALMSVFLSAPAADAQTFGYATFSAAVTAKGNVAQSSGVKSAKRVATGQYLVTFGRKVTTCVVVAGANNTGGGQATAAKVKDSPAKVEVRTFKVSGAPADRPFSLLVGCAG